MKREKEEGRRSKAGAERLHDEEVAMRAKLEAEEAARQQEFAERQRKRNRETTETGIC